MDGDTWINLGLVVLFVVIGGIFAATEMAIVTLRESQINRLAKQGGRGARAAVLARDPNTFLAAVQIGVTVAGFFSAAYGASALAPDVAAVLQRIGIPDPPAEAAAVIGMTLTIAYLSLVLSELVPKRLALQRSVSFATFLAPPLARFAWLMRPVIWLLSRSTNAVVKILGGDPDVAAGRMSGEEVRDILGAHQDFSTIERAILRGVLSAKDRSVTEVMRPRRDVDFLIGIHHIADVVEKVRCFPHSRYPVIGRNMDDVTGFVHIRDLLEPNAISRGTTVAEVVRPILILPGTNLLLPSLAMMRRENMPIAVVVDEYGGTDGVVTQQDLMEELVGEINGEHELRGLDEPHSGLTQRLDARVNRADFSKINRTTVARRTLRESSRICDGSVGPHSRRRRPCRAGES